MTEAPNVLCPQCDGALKDTSEPSEWECVRCGRRHRQVVLENIDRFQRVAERGGPLAPVAKAALEGVDADGDG